MTTDQLIALLVADLKPVDRRRVLHAVITALAIGLTAAIAVMTLTFTFPPEFLDERNLEFLSIKLLFASVVVATTAVFLPQLARPGAPMRGVPAFALIPFVMIAAAAVVALASAHFSAWPGMIVEPDSLTCLPSIPFIAILPFIALIWSLRRGAPTDRIRAGAFAGVAAGGLGAFACAFPCAEQSLPSIALWYGVPIGICAAIGAKLGPSLLRW
ncbi:MAG: DUF1109 domain-containing protein [Pseudomonadota bacterium]